MRLSKLNVYLVLWGDTFNTECGGAADQISPRGYSKPISVPLLDPIPDWMRPPCYHHGSTQTDTNTSSGIAYQSFLLLNYYLSRGSLQSCAQQKIYQCDQSSFPSHSRSSSMSKRKSGHSPCSSAEKRSHSERQPRADPLLFTRNRIVVLCQEI